MSNSPSAAEGERLVPAPPHPPPSATEANAAAPSAHGGLRKHYYWARVLYDGTDFCGFQDQKGLRTVQSAINDSLRELLGLGKGEDEEGEEKGCSSDVACEAFVANVSTRGASRTDAGVHALCQVVRITVAVRSAHQNMSTSGEGSGGGQGCVPPPPPSTCSSSAPSNESVCDCGCGSDCFPHLPMLRRLNDWLPTTIRCHGVGGSHRGFQPADDAASKEYRYYFTNTLPSALLATRGACGNGSDSEPREIKKLKGEATCAVETGSDGAAAAVCGGAAAQQHRNASRFAANVPMPLDIAAMRRCCALLVGTRDFRNFCSAGSNVSTTVRRVFACDVVEAESDSVEKALGAFPLPARCFVLCIEGEGFLKQMVRHIAASLWAVGAGRLSAAVWEELLLGAAPKCTVGSEDADTFGVRQPVAPATRKHWKVAPAKGLFLHRIDY